MGGVGRGVVKGAAKLTSNLGVGLVDKDAKRIRMLALLRQGKVSMSHLDVQKTYVCYSRLGSGWPKQPLARAEAETFYPLNSEGVQTLRTIRSVQERVVRPYDLD
ncbi:hypothetical protein NDN08_003711 [Rhodosorus marinus]|uniref:Uncharacterized protein n=1 Tax=Rhodosorus marinus TaxID=101924 RepID=A0AAV8UXA6_9RHOD|nr:hypothetical protein NDN08_003711 [Rhodosorus marinus]